VIVGQKKALYLAVLDWRRAPRHTALGGLLEETLRFKWRWPNRGFDDPWGKMEAALWGDDEEGTP
jgi:hypothetical protein